MRTLAFDGRMGAAGDMLLGALVAAGADPAVLAPVEEALPVSYAFDPVVKNGVAATDARVVHDEARDDGADSGGSAGDGGQQERSHDHEHAPGHTPGHGDADGDCPRGHDHAHADGAEGHGHTRTYAEVVDLVGGMDLPASVREEALATFELLGEAEAAVHGGDLDDTAFHEVGADDAVADVVGACLLLADLAPDRVVTTPLATGGGDVTFSHGVYPVPVPAVVELAERADWSLRGGPLEAELLTPTGAAILARAAEGVDRLPSLRVESSGYGAGGREFPDRPNVLRALVGEAPAAEPADARAGGATDDAPAGTDGADGTDAHDGVAGFVREDVTVLETNLDDATPELLGGLHESLRAAGALDVTVLPATAKKSRPGHLVTVVCAPADAPAVVRRLAVETGTLGVRETGTRRWVAERSVETVELRVGGATHEVGVKVARATGGDAYDYSAEYDDAAAAAREADVPVREVMRRAEAAARDGADGCDRDGV
ncbi:nickel pincer cofactor biosynthesis protein LarC [Candidatus Halobonum tyrrellensis]|uniref:Putative nickel insertion protein n=1 Tax=Candidatus Halobonum tyrrellensis G22 TaxID=1324957 RepID=V4HCK5_9EURY|nr:nickel pincer cofactor biosynthesis protein LarC [Candidatus Halobonum tyrrellensis]ESP88420.1 hypothetical protein K933_08172 [Candidatus Halobonum tyrrellensis G22]